MQASRCSEVASLQNKLGRRVESTGYRYRQVDENGSLQHERQSHAWRYMLQMTEYLAVFPPITVGLDLNTH